MTKEIEPDFKSTVQQLVRIGIWIGAPLLTKYGIDHETAALEVTGIVLAVGNFGWWIYWQVVRKPD